MTGTELEIIPPERSRSPAPTPSGQPSLQTTAANADLELLAVWLKSHVDGSDHTVPGLWADRPPLPRCPQSCRRRSAARHASIDVQAALETIRTKLGRRAGQGRNGQRLMSSILKLLPSRRIGSCQLPKAKARALLGFFCRCLTLPSRCRYLAVSRKFNTICYRIGTRRTRR